MKASEAADSGAQRLDRGRQKGMWRVSESRVSSGDARGYLVLWVRYGEADGKSLACNDQMQADRETARTDSGEAIYAGKITSLLDKGGEIQSSKRGQ